MAKLTTDVRVRLRPEDKELLRRAAEIAGAATGGSGSLSDFLREEAIVAARKLLAEQTASSNPT